MTATLRPFRPARVAAAAVAVGAALSLSACGAGQIAQTATQVAAINGNGADQANIQLRNVHVLFPTSSEFRLEEGGRAELVFTAINTSATEADRLVSIETEDAADVVLEGAPAGGVEIAPQASVTGGVPAGQITDPESDELTVILEDLSDQVRPGLTVPATFVFENAGEVRVDVPVDAGPVTPRAESSPGSSPRSCRTGRLGCDPWPRLAPAIAAPTVRTSSRNGWAAARSARPGAPWTRSRSPSR